MFSKVNDDSVLVNKNIERNASAGMEIGSTLKMSLF
jgi:hypothetical protein